jgi:hypothetical protein
MPRGQIFWGTRGGDTEEEGDLAYIPGSTVMTMFGSSDTRLSYGLEVSGAGKGDFCR